MFDYHFLTIKSTTSTECGAGARLPAAHQVADAVLVGVRGGTKVPGVELGVAAKLVGIGARARRAFVPAGHVFMRVLGVRLNSRPRRLASSRRETPLAHSRFWMS